MNRIYRSIWNQATGAYSAVSENVNSAGKRTMPGAGGVVAQFALKALAASMMLGFGTLALAGPMGGVVVGGTATINGAPGATVIDQASQNAVINWASFNIGKNESVTFRQPNSSSVALNRVLGADGTTIMGNLSANGKVFLVNPNGVMFGKGASVNVGGLVASTLDIANADFMAGNYKFSGNGGTVLNQGTINAPGGYVALLGAHVSNEGTIAARLGSVVLAAGKAITLDVAGDGLLNVTVDQGAVNALVENGGILQADGGQVLLSAQAAGNLLKTVVNNTGVIEARTIDTRGGIIKLLGDMQTGTVNAGGTLDASAPDGGNGGFIDTSAAHVNIAEGIHVTAQAATGLTGTWLIDPVDFTIAASGGNITGTDLTNSLQAADVKILSTDGTGGTAGDINVNDVVSWSANKLTLNAQNNINVNAAMHGTGTASLALEYGQANVAANNTSVYKVNAAIDLPSGNTFSTKLGSNGTPVAYTVINCLGDANSTTGTDLQGMNGNLTRNYALGSNIDASATATWNGNAGFTPVGDVTTGFTGKLDGLGHDITGLAITSSDLAVGMFRMIGLGGVVRDVNILGAALRATGSSYGADWGFGYGAAGIVAGRNQGLIANVRVSGGLIDQQNNTVGGLVGYNDGAITNSASSATMSGNTTVGGLVGQASATSTITASYATGAVSGSYQLGGLVGLNSGAIANSYATGAVSGCTNYCYTMGGLVGLSDASGTISDSYATGNVTGRGTLGGVVGTNQGTITRVYANGVVTGTSGKGGVVGDNYGSVATAYYNTTANAGIPGVGLANGGTGAAGTTGLTDSQMRVSSNYAFTFTTATGLAGNNWVMIGSTGVVNGFGGTLPMLSAEYSTTINSVHQLQLMALNRAAAYTLGSSFSAAATAGGDVWGTAGFIPVGYSGSNFTGSLDGTGHIISGLKIVRTTSGSYTGLFGWVGTGGRVANVGLEGAAITGAAYTGALVGQNSGTVSGSFVTGSVAGTIRVGGLVGFNVGTIQDTYAGSTVTGQTSIGGLVGTNNGTVATSYANGAVSATTASPGGLVGSNAGSVTGSFWDVTASGQSTSGGGTGLTTAQLKTLANYNSATTANGSVNPAWNLTSMWVVYDGQSAPLLRSFMKPLTITVSNSTKVYDGAATGAATYTASYSQPVDNSLLFGTNVITGTTAGAVNAGTYAVTASGEYSTSQTGYAITYVAGGLTITPRQVSLNGVSAGSKVYDGTTGAVLTGGTLSNVIAADAGNVVIDLASLVGTYASKNAGSGIAVSATGNLTGSASANYTLAPLTGVTGNITAKALTVTGLSVLAKQYDGLTSATATGGTLSGMVGGETLSLGASSGTYQDANAGTGKALTVTPGALVSGTGLAGNYTVTAPTGVTGTITAKALGWSGLTIENKTYDGNTSATIIAGSLTGLVGGQSLISASGGVFADQNAGSGKTVTVNTTLGNGSNGGLASNYTIANTTVTASIVQKAVTASGVAALSKTYDGSTAAVLTGGTLSGTVNGETLNMGALSGAFGDKNAATGKTVTVTGGTLSDGTGLASNYTLGAVTGVTGDITKKALTVSGVTVAGKVYDGTLAATVSGGTLNGLVGGETLSLSGQTGAFSDKNVGTAKAVTVSGATLGNGTGLAGNYTLAAPVGLTGTITARELSWNGLAVADKTYDGNAVAVIGAGSLSGLVNGETLVAASSAVFADKNAGAAKTVTVSTTLGNGTNGGLASNYTLASPNGVVASIAKADIGSVTAIEASNKTYDGTTGATLGTAGAQFNGMVSGDHLAVSAASGAFASKNAGAALNVAITGIALGGLDAANYNLVSTTGSATAAITPKVLTLDGLTASNSVYNGTVTAVVSGASLIGFVGSESLGGGLFATFADKNVGTNKAIIVRTTLAATGANGGLAANYTIADLTGLVATVTPKALTVAGMTAATKVYDGLNTATLVGGSLVGLAAGETLGFTSTGVFASASAIPNKTVIVSGTTLVDGTGLASNYKVTNPTTVRGTITPKMLTVSGSTAANKTYDGLVTASITGGTLGGLVGLETLSLTGLSGEFGDKNAGTNKTVTVSGGTLGNGANGGLASNYFVDASGTVTADITPKALTVTGVSAVNRVYDGGTAATLAGGALNGLVGSETLVLSSLAGTFADKNAGAGKTVTISGAALLDGTGLASNYTVANPVGVTAAITQASISAVTGLTATSKIYDGVASGSVTASGGTFDGMVAGDTLAASGAAVFANKDAGVGKSVTVTGIALGGLDAGNYNLATTTGSGTGTITPKALTIVGMSAVNKVYNGDTSASVTGGSIAGLVGSETLGVTGLSVAFDDKNVGTGKAVTATGTTLVNGGNGGLAANYTMADPTGFTASITPKALTVTGMTAATKAYDGLLAASLAGGALSGLVGGETLVYTGGTGVFTDKNAGTNKAVTVSGTAIADGTGLASNYTVTNPSTVTGSITQKALTLTGIVASNKVYDGNTTASVAGGQLDGLIGAETLGVTGLTASFDDKNAGSGKTVTATGATLVNGGNGGLASNYAVANPTGLVASIAQKALTIDGMVANNKVYDGATTASLSGGSLTGLVGAETLGVTGLTASFDDKNAGSGKTVTATGATLVNGGNGGLASNYLVGNPTGLTANITQKALTVTGTLAGDKVYDGTNTAQVSGGVLSGLVGAETLGIAGQTAVFSDKNAAIGKAVTVSGTTLVDGVDGLASNYVVSNPTGLTASITQKTLTVTGTVAGDKVYDGSTTAQVSGGVLNGLVGAEVLGIAGQTAVFSDKNAASGKAVTVSGTTLVDGVDGLASNYVVGNPTGLTASITPKALIVSGTVAGDKVYDGTASAQIAGGVLNGLVGAETLGITGQTAVFSDKNAATGKAVTVTGTTLVDGIDGLASNYVVGNPTGLTANITQKALTVTGTLAADKVYDGTNTAQVSGGVLSGLVGAETLGIAGQTVLFSDKNAAAGKAVTVSGTTLVDGVDGRASNYVVSNPTGLTASITQKTLMVTGTVAGDKVYDGSTTAQVSGGVLNGLVGAEVLGIAGQTAVFSDKNAASGKAVTVSGTTLVDGVDGMTSNYVVGNPTGLTASITPKALTVSGTVAGDKVYDGTAIAQVAGGVLNGLVGAETLGIAGQTAVFSDKNAAAGKAVTVTGTTLVDGIDGLASNYVVGNPTGLTANITQKALTVTGTLAADKVYDGTNTAQVSGGVLSGLVGAETLGIAGQTAVFSDKNAAIGKAVTVSGTTLVDGVDGRASNYVVSNPTGLTASITQKALTVTGTVAGDKVYDGSTTAQVSGGVLNGLVGAEVLGIAGQTAVFSDKNAASGKAVTVSGTTLVDGVDGLASNYVVGNPTGLTASITQKALTVTGAIAGDKVYDGVTTAQVSGGSLIGLVGAETLGIAGQSAVFSDKNAASGKAVTVTGTTLVDGVDGLASNYSISNPTGLTASITQKNLTVTNLVASDKVYDGSSTAQLSGGVLRGLVGAETLGIAGQTAVFSDKNAAGGKTVTVSGTTLVDGVDGLASNYAVGNPTGLTASITQKALMVTGTVVGDKVYDGTTSAQLSGGVLSGLVGGETLAIAGQAGVFSDKNAASGKSVTVTGTTLVDGVDGLASNYLVSNPTGLTASITPKALTVTGTVAGDKVYDGLTTALVSGGVLNGLVGAETLGIAGQTAAFNDKNAAKGKAVTVSGTTLVDSATGLASNYTVGNPTGLTASITPKALTVTGTVAGDKVYDGTTAALVSGSVLNGLVGAETLGIAGQTAVFSDKNAANAKTVTVSGTTLVDSATGLASNYTVGNPTGLTASISRAALTGVTGITAANKVYDATTAATVSTANAAFTGKVAGDSLMVTGGSGAFSDKDAAAGKTVAVTGLVLAGADAGNYVFGGAASTTATITQAALAVKVDNAGKDQGRANPAFSASYAGLVGGDTLASSVTGKLAFATDATTASTAGSYLVAASGQASTNYALAYTPGVLTVSPTEALQNAVTSAVASATVVPAQGTMVATGTSNAATPVQELVTQSDSGTGTPPVRQNANAVVAAMPGLNLVVVNRGLLLPPELAEAPGGSN